MEGKVYDFSVEVDDSIKCVNYWLSNDTLYYRVVSVDSVETLLGFKKRIILYEYINDKEEIWVEGIGSFYGIMNSCNNAYEGCCGSFDALCYKEYDQLIYQHPDYNVCFYEAIVGIPTHEQASFSVYPNPANEQINIIFSDDNAVSI